MGRGKEAHSSRREQTCPQRSGGRALLTKIISPTLRFPVFTGTTNAVLPQDEEEWLRQSHGNTRHPAPSTWKDTRLSQNPCPTLQFLPNPCKAPGGSWLYRSATTQMFLSWEIKFSTLSSKHPNQSLESTMRFWLIEGKWFVSAVLIGHFGTQSA